MQQNDSSKRPATESKYGDGVYAVVAGKTLTIETSPAGVEILSEEVPAGKQWEVTTTQGKTDDFTSFININIVETDV